MKKLKRKRSGWKKPAVKKKMNISIVRGAGCDFMDDAKCTTLQTSQ